MRNRLDRKNVENVMSLTSLQQGMLYHYISDEENKQYHEQLSLKVKGDIKLDLLQKAWDFVIENNETLRTVFRWKGIEKPVQIVLKNYQVSIQLIDLTKDTYLYKSIEIVKEQDLSRRIDITEETLRIYLCRIDENTHEMIISNHHILFDGWSNGIILKEVMEAYNCFYVNKEPERVNKTKFSQFIKYLNSINNEEARKYWSNYLEGFDDKVDYFSCKEVGIHKEILYKVDESTANRIKKFSKENKVLLSSILYGAWGVLLQKFNNSNEVLFGTTVSGRPENIGSIDKMVGLFINTIPLVVKSDENATLLGLINSLDESLNERKGFENTALTDIKEYCGLKANEMHFNSIVTIENYPLDFSTNNENVLSIEGFSIVEKTNYNMALGIFTYNGIEFRFNFNSLSIDEGIVAKLGVYLERIMENLINNPYISIENIDLLSTQEKNEILYDFNNTRSDYPKNKTIHELFEAQVEKTPDNIAVVFEDKKLTYRELNEKSNSFAKKLRDKGTKADSIVGIMVERSLEMIIGIMGILKSGGAYLPIDPNYPKERIEFMLKDSGSKILISRDIFVETIEFDGYIVDLYDESSFSKDCGNLERINNSTNLAYIIYTSGTTGNPKGAMIEHRSLVNRLNWMQKKYPISEKDTILQKTTYTFDVSVWEILWWALVGAKVCMLSPKDEMDPLKIIETIDKHEVTTMHFVPSMLDVFLYCVEVNRSNINLSSLRQVFSSGEALNFKQVSRFYKEFKSNKNLINLYGPTEATIDVSYYDCCNDDKKIIPIGKPINNTKLYILNNTELVPIGVVGELYIAGDGLARGYINRSELTAEKFIDNPFEAGKKMYRTGDLARWLQDGNIEFLGRVDNQVKIRGFRIELSEIESRLLQHENINEAAVSVKEYKDNEKYICAYIVSDKNLKELDLKAYLKEKLPEYMIPTYFTELEKMPLTANGKLNRRALPEPNLDEAFSEYEAPRDETEEALAKIWSEVLGIEKIGINDNFFDLGGHSLKATMIMAKIHKKLNKEVPLKELFKSPTIKGISKYIESAEDNIYSNIVTIEESEYYKTSSAQKRMYLLQQFDKDSVAYNMPAIFELEGEVDKNKIEETFGILTERHEALRTYFENSNGEIIQKLQKKYKFNLVFRNEKGKMEDVIDSFVRPFNLENAPLFRVKLIKNEDKTYLLIDMHHIISDGLSLSILIKEFVEIYGGKILEPLKLQYKDFAAWQNDFLKSEKMKDEEEYWINRFSDEIPVLNMPTDYERPTMQSFKGDSVSFQIDEDTTLKLIKLTKETGTTMHMVLLSAFYILLAKYSGQEDIVIGTPIAGRSHADLENIMGMFVNTLALRNKPEEDKKYIDFLKEVKEESLKAYENQSYQLETLVEKLDIRRDTSRNPLFDVMFNMVDTVTNVDIELDNLRLKLLNCENKISKFDLTLNAVENNDKFSMSIEYCSKLYKNETIERLSSHYGRILCCIVKNVEIKLSEVDLLSDLEKNQILYQFNNTKADYPYDKTINGLFEAQVEKTPDNIAVVFDDEKLTFKELNERANSLARVLRGKGTKAESIIGIMVDRSIEMIVGILGVLKAGGAYLPIDPVYPKERIEYILEDSGVKILLSMNDLIKNIEFDGEIIDLLSENLYACDSSNLKQLNISNNLAYVIYTSGTTGNPKGVMIEHKSLNNYIEYAKVNYCIEENMHMPLYTSISFDLTVTSVFTPLISGNSIIIYENVEIDELAKKVFCGDDKSVIKLTPAHLGLLKEMKNINKSITRFVVGGEELTEKVAKSASELFDNKIEIVNEYGPTEATVGCITHKYNYISNYRSSVLIGKPISNTQIYILNCNNKPMPIGAAGEIYISGDGLARGYLSKPELTAEKFVANPFEVGTRMYRTGDIGRWLPDGNIEFLGRVDSQVKIRGFRIELGEIENRLLQHEDIKDAVVLVKENKNNEKYLCAYVVSEKNLKALELRGYLKETLPEYMIPTYFVEMKKLPLTINGKLNRNELPEPNLDEYLTEYEAPRNKGEEKLTKIWNEILGVDKVGINDNFFDLGGNSLKASVLISKIHKEFNKELSLKELFKSPTIKELGKNIDSVEENPYSKIKMVEENEHYETSSAQKRMYMIQQFDKDSIAYNMPIVLELDGNVYNNKIEEIFRTLTKRHDALRTYFETSSGEIIQKVQSDYIFRLKYRSERGDIKDIINKFVCPFDLGKAPLFRVELVENKGKAYLLIDMHHIISDGLSMGILIKEFTELYRGKVLEPLKLQYKDFAAWQNSLLGSEEIKKQEEYWISRFNDEIPVLNIPTDYERPSMQSFVGDSTSFIVDEDTTLKLRRLAKETGTTMHMVLLSAFNILLSKYCGQEDIVIGTPIAGRPHADLQNIMGVFVNTLALRNKPEGDKNYIDFLKEVKENSLEAYENQSYQLEALVEKLDVRKETSRNPLFDVMFNMVDTVTGVDIKLDDFTLQQYKNPSKISKFDLTLIALESDVKLNFNMEYCSKLFSKETVERLGTYYVRVLDSIVNNMDVKISEIELLTENERNQMLYEYNNTKIDYLKDKTLQELFEIQVEKTPQNIAVIYKNEKITYKELNGKANQLAQRLSEKGVGNNKIVGVMIERSIDMIIGILGILKAGGAYLPIEPSYPEERIKYLLHNSSSEILVTQSKYGCMTDLLVEKICIDESSIYLSSDVNLEKGCVPEDLAYVIYTSGSTGNPKGVMITHEAVINTIHDINSKFNVTEKDKIIGLSSVCFDLSVYDIFGALCTGASLVQISDQRNIKEIIDVLNNHDITIWNSVPAIMDMLIDSAATLLKNASLRLVLLSGDWISLKLPRKIKEIFSNANVVSLGGATEASIWSIYYPVEEVKEEWKSIPYGVPLGNQHFYVLDKKMHLCPYGVPGELYIGGVGLAKGYINDNEKTKNAFIIHREFNSLYRTGDWGRFHKDGYIEFLGRKDQQIKIRGFRIELGEIENRLLQHQSIKEAVVQVKDNKERGKYICTYIVSANNFNELVLRNYLKETLPEYMIPDYFVQLEKMPLTANGKLDRRALPEPNLDVDLTEYEAPRSKLEEELAKLWREALEKEKVGINDNFFDFGGNSLKATMLIFKIHKELNKEVPIREFFISPTIKGLSMYIENTEESYYSKIDKIEAKEFYETSSAQKRMYTLQQFDKDNVAYNMPVVFELEGTVDKDKIEETFRKLTERHEVLRTYFETFDGQVIQRLNRDYIFELVHKNESKEIEDIIMDFVTPFDLEKAPLFKVELVEKKEQAYLLIDMHHIISDGLSMGILISEFVKIYGGKILDPLKLQYKDFAAWQNSFLVSEEIKKQEEYWLSRFVDEIPVLNMPIDYKRLAMKSFEGDSVSFEINNDITLKLRRLTKETGTTMHMVLLSAFTILLSKYSGQEDIVIGNAVAGRPHADLENIMGMFVNTLAMRNYPEGGKTYREFLIEVKENALRAYENQDYQFEELVEKLNVPRNMSRNPVFDVMFILQNMDIGELDVDGICLKTHRLKTKTSKFDLTVSAVELEDHVSISLEYCSKLFKCETIERMSKHMENIIRAAATNIDIKLSEIDMLTEEERQQILKDFNSSKSEYPNDKTIHELFEERVEASPNNVALVFKNEKITYGELNKRSNQLAHTLREQGVKRDEIIGIMVERSIDMIVAILGVIKAGGAYMPIDPDCPIERIQYILEDSSTGIIFAHEGGTHNVGYEEVDKNQVSFEGERYNLENVNKPEDLSCVIYTSGSTGKPKGVMLEHRGVVNLAKYYNKMFCFEKNKNIVHMANVSSDASLCEIFPPLLYGATIYILEKEQALDRKAFIKFVQDNQINIAQFIPMTLKELLGQNEKPESLNTVLVGGKRLEDTLKNQIISKGYRLTNHYGHTEVTADSLIVECEESKSSIRKPIANTRVYILDKDNMPTPIGVPGELCVAGDGLARGYLNNPELTEIKFVKNRFIPEERIYRTGDLASWQSDGGVTIIGEKGSWVVIRGFRIELGEIESQLLKHEHIKEAVVVDKTDLNGIKYLCAYIVTDHNLSATQMRLYLSKELPDYMIPSHFASIDRIPFTPTGKVDRKALPRPEIIANIGIKYVHPTNEVEAKLIAIWEQVLGIRGIGINHNFFEVGGQSLKAALLLAKVYKELNVEVPLSEVLKGPTIKELSQYIGA